MKNCLPSVFGVSPSETAEGLCDLIRTQWRIDQTELIIRSISHQKEGKMEEKETSKKKMKEKEISTCRKKLL